MERQEIFNILQNFNLPKNKKDIITDLILNNKDNNNNNNTNTGNNNIIDISNANIEELDDNGLRIELEKHNIGYIEISIEDGLHEHKSYIKIGDVVQYVYYNESFNRCIAVIGLNINGEDNMNFNEYQEAAMEVYNTFDFENPDFSKINVDKINYILEYIKKYNKYYIIDGSKYHSRNQYISYIYSFIQPKPATSVISFPIGIYCFSPSVGINNTCRLILMNNLIIFELNDVKEQTYAHVFKELII